MEQMEASSVFGGQLGHPLPTSAAEHLRGHDSQAWVVSRVPANTHTQWVLRKRVEWPIRKLRHRHFEMQAAAALLDKGLRETLLRTWMVEPTGRCHLP